ncbi:ATP-binding cassette domain-containing protein [Pseudoflavitalea sp. X16]|uniref:ABC transporter ATP-binding protein n=1 Tax=Paraflavitalea devenefica TaxID=2716334 RepID=UPI001420616A|nr:ATP-binding cassette domain-containing protein [Paraflavitalea devenefica]NII26391.1 ATP-binding cassette domain-containing protein [Paraflavitalea devenefica]
MHPPVVSIRHVSHRFGKQTILDNISLTVPAGSIYGFLGPNGAGKTTTLRLLLGLLQKQDGSIQIFGKDIATNRLELLRRTGSLIEQPSLYGHLNARENLDIYRLSYPCEKKRIAEVLEIVKLTDTGRKKVRAFSLGMKQRLAIAIALLPDPDLLVLDEPSNGLDPVGIIEMRNLITDLHTTHHKTVIISSHLLAEIGKIATDLIIIHQGRVRYEGSLQGLYQLDPAQNDLENLFMQIISNPL